MYLLCSSFSIRKTFTVRFVAICAAWLSGTLLSAYMLHQTPLASLMCSVYFYRTTIVGLIVSLLIPFVLTYVLLTFSNFYFILPCTFLKAFLFFYCYGGLYIAFNDAGWLICTLVLFSDSISVLLLLDLWFCAAARIKNNAYVRFLIVLFVGCIDYYIISPFTEVLLKY